MPEKQTKTALLEKNRQLRARLKELEATLHATRSNEDAVETRSRLALIVESSDDAIISTTLDGIVESWNRAAEQLFGYTARQAVGHPVQKLMMSVGDADTFARKLNSIRRKKGTEHFEITGRCKGGALIEVSVKASPITDDTGKLLGVSVNIRDISQHRRAELALQESEMRYRRLFEAARDGILILDAESGIITDANPYILDLLSFGFDEVAGKKLWEIGLFTDIKSSKMAFRELQHKGDIRYEDLPLETKDGRRIDVEFVSNIYEVGDRKVVQCNVRDITERKLTEQRSQQEKAFSGILMQSFPDIFFLLGPQATLLQWNNRLEKLLGLLPEEMEGTNALAFIHEKDRPRVTEKLRQALETGSASTEARLNLTNGLRDYILTGTRVETLRGVNVIGIGVDITERKQAETRLRESEEKFRLLFESSRDALMTLAPPSWKFTSANAATLKLFGVASEAEFTALGPWDVSPEQQPDGRSSVEKAKAMIAIAMRESSHFFEWEHQRIDGTPFTADILLTRLELAGQVTLQATMRDISERKQVEEAIRSSRDLLRSVVENAPMRVFWKDKELRYLGCNTAFARDAGMAHPKELYGKDDFQMGWRDQAELYRNDDMKVMESGKPKLGFEEPQTTPDGRTIWLRTSKVPLRDAAGRTTGLLGIYEDISRRKQAEASLSHLNRALRTLSAGNHALVHSNSEDELWQGVCRTIVEEGKYLLAWIGYAHHDEAKSVKVMASHAVKPGYAENIHVSWAHVPEGRGPTGTAVRSGQTQYIQHIADDPSMEPWRKQALAYGYQASIALPLREKGKTFGALTIYAAEADAFNADEIALLEEMAEDLSYGIISLRTRAEHEQHATILRQSLIQSIETIADTVEARDPYTAGHQRRVGELASAIAREMDLPEEQVNGIYLAGIVHDLGKIHIPAEILAKPAKLNEIEYMLIQRHPQDGYDILKDVEFPWPIAEIILQHHERLDGSGYPQGLKEKKILLESKIMAVADVVEAMSSHRPYRAGMGIDTALAEIERGRGKQYDPNAVDACIRLFRERGYSIPD